MPSREGAKRVPARQETGPPDSCPLCLPKKLILSRLSGLHHPEGPSADGTAMVQVAVSSSFPGVRVPNQLKFRRFLALV
jgi:hypothetical protein